MSDSERITLEGQAVKEILKDARRSKEIYKDFGALALQKRDVLPNKRFLNNTLVSTLRHSYRQDLKGKDGSERKYKQHMASRRRTGGRNRAEHDDFQREGEPENVDYGEFDAIKYSDQCTGLYIRDSRRKHAQMSDNFVEKTGKSDSESEKSFTEYDDPPPPSAKEEKSPPPPAKVKRWKHDKFEAKWSDTGSADDYTSDRDDHHGVEDEAEPGIVDQKLRSEYRKYEKLRKKKIDITQPSTSRDYESYEDNEDSDESDQDEKSVKKKGKIVKEVKVSDESAKNSSASEEESNKNVSKKVVKKSKKVKKLPVAGKDLAEIISKRNMKETERLQDFKEDVEEATGFMVI
ncbi:hypothetical protein MAR_023928 [Mya arenaria]|uniref:Uncharacterized protein n=1 Tax=Mya arenaria TaxID=6604 RepID=A0ABY7DS99_MYAAR|nr:hypothetical protein MAR_023928 [Mya arenaria]